PMVSVILRLTGVSLLLLAVRVVPDSLLRKGLAFDKLSQAEIASGLVTLPVVIGLAWNGAGVWALAAGTVAMALVQTIVVYRFGRWCPGVRIGSKRIWEVLRYSLATLGSRIC